LLHIQPPIISNKTIPQHTINQSPPPPPPPGPPPPPPHEADIAEQLEHSIDRGGIKFDLFTPNEKQWWGLFTSMQHTDRNSYYGTDRNPDAYGHTTDFTYMAGSQYVYNFDWLWFMPSALTTGMEYNYDNLKDEMLGYNREISQKVHIGSLFLQNEWKNRQWSILLGGRLDKHSLMDHVIFSPRANLRFNPTDDINLRASYSTGFRAPQTFDEDLHVSVAGGDIIMVERAKDLKEEKSRSISVSADMYRRRGAFQFNYLIEGFYTKLNDVFVLDKIGWNEEYGAEVKERRNGSGARVMGLTLEGKMAYLSSMQLQAGLTWQKSRYDEPEQWSEDETVPPEKKMFRTPNVYGYFTATYSPLKPLNIALSGTYTGSMLVQHLAGVIEQDEAVTTPSFFDMNLKVSYDFNLYKSTLLQFNAGVENIFNAYQSDFDKGKDRDSAYIYGPSMPRSYFAGIKLNF
ncbi:MAG: TonB-dependent receptor, partial [Bacteroides sp.]|nr:TonB-dependent receptor [Bacteroides sp.]